jgi:hypothetical protein
VCTLQESASLTPLKPRVSSLDVGHGARVAVPPTNFG